MYVETPVSTHAHDEKQMRARNWSFALQFQRSRSGENTPALKRKLSQIYRKEM